MLEPNLDRFANNSIKDPQEERVCDYCVYSGDEIYLGDSYLESPEGDILKDDIESVVGHYQLLRKWAGEEII